MLIGKVDEALKLVGVRYSHHKKLVISMLFFLNITLARAKFYK